MSSALNTLIEAMRDIDPELENDARAELAQLRWRVAMLEVLEGEDGLTAANRLMDACERGDIPQQILPDIQMARNEIVSLRATVAEQARAVEKARRIMDFFKSLAVLDEMDDWLDAHPAPQADEAQ